MPWPGGSPNFWPFCEEAPKKAAVIIAPNRDNSRAGGKHPCLVRDSSQALTMRKLDALTTAPYEWLKKKLS